ncbi:MAG TPA: hypothetical protein VMU83_05425 [Hanamia sp.]|nr:hypothetical protein [Hanamia sp.]
MRLRFQILPMLCIYLILISATPILKRDLSKISKHTITLSDHNNPNLLKFHKLNFFQILIVKFYLTKNKLQNGIKADKLASASLVLGIGACGLIFLSLLFPYSILLALPVGIAAMITGHSAIRNKTSFVGKARMGKILGFAAVIIFAALLVLVALILISSGGSSIDN